MAGEISIFESVILICLENSSGIAFPSCLSVNNCICHFSPLTSENDVTLADGDVIKVDMGAHVDGYIAVVAYTHVIGASKEKPVTGKVNLNRLELLCSIEMSLERNNLTTTNFKIVPLL